MPEQTKVHSALFSRREFELSENSYIENGGVAQLGEHLPCKQGVKGSNPSISIENVKHSLNELRSGSIVP